MIRRTRGFGIPGIPGIDDALLQPMKVHGGLTSEMLRRGLATEQLLSGAPQQRQQESKSASTAQSTQTPTQDQNKR